MLIKNNDKDIELRLTRFIIIFILPEISNLYLEKFGNFIEITVSYVLAIKELVFTKLGKGVSNLLSAFGIKVHQNITEAVATLGNVKRISFDNITIKQVVTLAVE
jgi:hypothetical protein